MPFHEMMVAPIRQELTRHGVRELRTPEEVDHVLGPRAGTAVLAVNSVCGCAAGRMRPAFVIALRNERLPAAVATVFAGQDLEATARAREYLAPYPPSSPSLFLLRDGEVVFALERKDIEHRAPEDIAMDLRAAFDRFCAG
ncbi:MAG TPA: BrxA/BrxB family bacilliredoxin [Longimicrobiales bacterium]|nr:BrxA/BrxB family bacilliredoxin [Longimicrobiales bacterium]